MKTEHHLASLLVIALATANLTLLHAAAVGTAFTYQGRLRDQEAPASGNYDLRFTLFDAAASGAQIGDSILLENVNVVDGLFSIPLDFGTGIFTGQARWLQIEVSPAIAPPAFTVLQPRQSITPAPQAIFAANASTAQTATTAQTANNITWNNVNNAPAGFADGVDNDTLYSAGTGLLLNGQNQFSVGYAGSGVNGAAARSDHDHFGQTWSGSLAGGGLKITNLSGAGRGLVGQQGTGSGYLFNVTAGLWGDSQNGPGVFGTSGGDVAILGQTLGGTGLKNGVQGVSGSTSGRGVYGHATATSGFSIGVYGETDALTGVGVIARGAGPSGVALQIQDGGLRVAGAGLNSPTAAFIHESTATNTNYDVTTIDNPMCNGQANVLLIVTPRAQASFWSSPFVTVFFDVNGYYGPANRWVLINRSTHDTIEFGDTFNVLVIKP